MQSGREDALEERYAIKFCFKLGKNATETYAMLQITFRPTFMNVGCPRGVLGCPRGVMVKAMNCGIVVREFVLQSRYYVHFRANTLGKGMNPLILPPAMGK